MTEAAITDVPDEPGEEFLAVLAEFLPELTGRRPENDVPLASYGLDSLGSISLMLAMEDALGFTFPEEQLTPEVFATTASLWKAVSELRASEE